MGSSVSQLTTDTFKLEQLAAHYTIAEETCGKGFLMCVDAPIGPEGKFTLSESEIRCMRMYASLYGDYQRQFAGHMQQSEMWMMKLAKELKDAQH